MNPGRPYRQRQGLGRSATILLSVALSASLLAQTRITPPTNRFSPEQDVQLGREAAAEVERELPIIRDDQIEGYLENLGRRLVDAVPPELQWPPFRYTFTPVNAKEINAFALPGGPMFINRGMIEAASSEAEVAGVMAHELSHVVLRHGTAQATKAQGFQLGAVAGAILGAVIGGNAGRVVAEGSQFGLSAYFLKYSREYERQADLLGAQIMARAGYDPRNLARVFEVIAQQGGRGGPQWLSSHPNPGNRTAYIMEEARSLPVADRPPDQRGFARTKTRLADMAPAPRSTETASRTTPRDNVPVGSVSQSVEPPSPRYQRVRGGDVFELAVPDNWRSFEGSNAMKFAPEGGFGQYRDRVVFTHGLEVGIARNGRGDLRTGTEDLVDTFTQSNRDLQQVDNARSTRVAGRQALVVPLRNRSEVTGREESVALATVPLRDGNLLYLLLVAPREEASSYDAPFRRALESLRLGSRW